MKRVAMVMAMAIGVVGSVVAQNADQGITPNIDAGTKEIRLHGSYDGDTPLDYELSIGGGYGYFICDGLELAVELAVENNDLMTLFEVGAVVEYNIDTGSAWVPFAGLGAFYVGAEADDDYYNDPDSGLDADTAVAKAMAGVKYFIRNDIAISLRADYSVAADDLYVDEDGKQDDSNFKTVLALRYYWD
jgi:opacity protein-like surface antigen